MSWLAKIFQPDKSESPSEVSGLLFKLRGARFRQFCKNYYDILKLLADGIEKQKGDFILDKQYIISLSDKIFDFSYKIVYDLNIFTNYNHIKFYNLLDKIKQDINDCINQINPSISPEKFEYSILGINIEEKDFENNEYEYNLLRKVIIILGNLTPIEDLKEEDCKTLHDIVRFCYETILKSLKALIFTNQIESKEAIRLLEGDYMFKTAKFNIIDILTYDRSNNYETYITDISA